MIGALQADGRRPCSRIAADLRVSESVVRYRVQRLEWGVGEVATTAAEASPAQHREAG